MLVKDVGTNFRPSISQEKSSGDKANLDEVSPGNAANQLE